MHESAQSSAGVPLSRAQRLLWNLGRLPGGGTAYNIHVAYALRGPLDAERLTRAVERVYRENPALHTRFVDGADGPLQVSAPDPYWSVDRRMTTASELPGCYLREAAREFDLMGGQVFVARLHRVDEDHHVLEFNVPHLLADGWSMGLIWDAVRAYYLDEDHPEFDVRHAVDWESDADTDAWSARLAGTELPPLPLRLRGGGPPDRRSVLESELSTGTAAAVREASGEGGFTPFTVLLTAYAIALSRFTGRSEITVSTPYANRRKPELQRAIGYFVSMLPLSLRVDEEQSLTRLATEVFEETRWAMAHPDLDMDRLLRGLDQDSGRAHNPLQHFVLAWQHGISGSGLGAVRVDRVPQPPAQVKFPLALLVNPRGETFALQWEFDSELIAPYAVEALDREFRQLLDRLAVSPGSPVGAVAPSVDRPEAAERSAPATGAVASAPGSDLLSRWADIAAAHGSRTALVRGARRLDYREVDERSDAVAAALQEQAVAAGEFVGLAVRDGIDRAVAALGILKAGAAYVPLSREWPAARLARACAELGVRTAVTDTGPAPAPDVTSVPCAAPPGRRPTPVGRTPDSAAYVNFTSGTTGEPKAIVCTDRGVVRLVTGQEFAPLDEESVMLQAAPPDFDAYTLELWGPLLNGGTSVSPEGGGPLTAARLRAAVDEGGVTTAWLTSALFNTLADLDVSCFAGLRTLLVGGDTVSPQHVARVYRNHRDVQLVNGYGPTENTTFTSCFPIPRTWPSDRPVPIGQPLRGGDVQVWDERRRPLPPGFVGELVATGAGVARGYHGDRSNARFTNVHQDGGWVRAYRTGDLGYADPDGCLHYLGRRDSQVKVNGRRLDLAGLEHVLRAHPRVHDAAALVSAGEQGQTLVVAVTGDVVGSADLTGWLSERVPSYQLPDRLVSVERLPLTTNGKLDRGELVRLMAEPREAGAGRELTTHERALADIWSTLLGVPVLSPDAHFFQLGGNSLLSMSVQTMVEQRTGAHLPVTTVLARPVLSQLASALAEAEAAVRLEPGGEDAGELPLSGEQRRLWFLHRLAPSAAYNIPLVFEVPSALSGERLEGALRELVRRHRALRSVVAERDGEPSARTLDAADWRLRRSEEPDTARLVTREAGHVFALDREFPLRALLTRRQDGSRQLVLTFHHIAFDGHSLGPFLAELATLCEGRRPPPPAYGFADVVRRQSTPEYAREVAAALDHFTERLAGAPLATALPGAGEGAGSGAVRVRLAPRGTARVAELARAHGVSEFAFWLGCVAVVLARLSGEDDQVIATPVANRQRGEFQSVVGLLANTVPLRVRVPEQRSFGELLREVFDALATDLAHQSCPLDELAARLGVAPGRGRPPLSQVLFSATSYAGGGAEVGPWAPRPVTPGDAKYPLSIGVSRVDGEDQLVLEYDRECYGEGQITSLATALRRAAEHFLDEPHRPVGELALARITPSAGRAGAADAGAFVPITEHIAHQVERRPEATAVHGPSPASTGLDYASVWRRAGVHGAALAARGVGRGSRVAVLMRRTEDLPVALLGVLLTGAAYVPLDPAYPTARLAFVLADSAPDALLTDLPDVPAELAALAPVVPVAELTRERHDPGWRRVVPAADDPAYVIYTSGTTGRPKGVVVRHEGLHWLRHWAEATYDAADLRQVLAGTSVCFDLSVFEIFVTWSLGGGLRLAGNALDLVSGSEGVTLVNTVPSVWEEVLGLTTPPSTLRVLNLAGEPLRRALVERTVAAAGALRLFNLYGPTEDTTYSTAAEVPPTGTGPVPIGRPLPGTTAYVLDAAGRPVPDGFPGELHLGGRTLAAEYLNRPDLTAERFVPDPFGGGSMYRTGDRVRVEPDGSLVHLGRLDDQCKIRGFRVEPGEVERVLHEHPDVAEVHVTAREPGTPRARLVAFLAGGGPAPEAAGLAAWAAGRLPAHMVPSSFVVLEGLPRTPSGKVDRAALASHRGADAPAGEVVAPVGPLESWLVDWFAALPGADRVGATTHFTAAGGDTPAAEALAEAVLRAHGVTLALRDVLDHPTPRALAALVRGRLDVESGPGSGTLLI
ncbi:non-ribosomal peptide synthetase [Streptomyces profundus]|uniref:non-ribosomal peptide synthetase n=1 Tax=Streptomyces profundus TaxID=2867410 RepID=UPI001D15EB17|nr:non-ribosomal peptide synthetase [Streptomyces sp. MA3_2.13]UED87534.1 amino acid adenylation domain-containing protein [Streptomyces sp. MA3_2.13]